MTIDRARWSRYFSQLEIPSFPCPACKPGKLKAAADPVKLSEPEYSKIHRDTDDWEPDHTLHRWSLMMECDESKCGEIAHMMGDTEFVDTVVEVDGKYFNGLEEVCEIQAFFPAPPIFPLSNNVPARVKRELRLAFQLYWTDAAACVGRIRTAVEELLDERSIPRKTKSKTGKMVRMTLSERIKVFSVAASQQEILDGLRVVGNIGVHESNGLSDGDLFDALDVLQYLLAGIYDSQSIQLKSKKLIAMGKK